MSLALRLATRADIPLLERLIADSSRGLARGDYSDAQIEGALDGSWGVHSQLIDDGTYFVAEVEGRIVGCGGWSYRETRFGGDRYADRSAAKLDPARDAARIRAFFVHPDWARRGIATALLERCEAAAAASGFRRLELVATLPGWRLYRTRGYRGDERQSGPLPNGLEIEFIVMTKSLG
jgi:GNAT superfamily N-acetyltransferase